MYVLLMIMMRALERSWWAVGLTRERTSEPGITTLNNTKWRGETLRIGLSKPSNLTRYQAERQGANKPTIDENDESASGGSASTSAKRIGEGVVVRTTDDWLEVRASTRALLCANYACLTLGVSRAEA